MEAGEAEMGFTPAEAVAALRRAFEREGWRCAERWDGDEQAEFEAGSQGGSTVRVSVRRLADRRLGPTVRLPRSMVSVEICAGPERGPAVEQIVRLSLHRGGG